MFRQVAQPSQSKDKGKAPINDSEGLDYGDDSDDAVSSLGAGELLILEDDDTEYQSLFDKEDEIESRNKSSPYQVNTEDVKKTSLGNDRDTFRSGNYEKKSSLQNDDKEGQSTSLADIDWISKIARDQTRSNTGNDEDLDRSSPPRRDWRKSERNNRDTRGNTHLDDNKNKRNRASRKKNKGNAKNRNRSVVDSKIQPAAGLSKQYFNRIALLANPLYKDALKKLESNLVEIVVEENLNSVTVMDIIRRRKMNMNMRKNTLWVLISGICSITEDEHYQHCNTCSNPLNTVKLCDEFLSDVNEKDHVKVILQRTDALCVKIQKELGSDGVIITVPPLPAAVVQEDAFANHINLHVVANLTSTPIANRSSVMQLKTVYNRYCEIWTRMACDRMRYWIDPSELLKFAEKNQWKNLVSLTSRNENQYNYLTKTWREVLQEFFKLVFRTPFPDEVILDPLKVADDSTFGDTEEVFSRVVILGNTEFTKTLQESTKDMSVVFVNDNISFDEDGLAFLHEQQKEWPTDTLWVILSGVSEVAEPVTSGPPKCVQSSCSDPILTFVTKNHELGDPDFKGVSTENMVDTVMKQAFDFATVASDHLGNGSAIFLAPIMPLRAIYAGKTCVHIHDGLHRMHKKDPNVPFFIGGSSEWISCARMLEIKWLNNLVNNLPRYSVSGSLMKSYIEKREPILAYLDDVNDVHLKNPRESWSALMLSLVKHFLGFDVAEPPAEEKNEIPEIQDYAVETGQFPTINLYSESAVKSQEKLDPVPVSYPKPLMEIDLSVGQSQFGMTSDLTYQTTPVIPQPTVPPIVLPEPLPMNLPILPAVNYSVPPPSFPLPLQPMNIPILPAVNFSVPPPSNPLPLQPLYTQGPLGGTVSGYPLEQPSSNLWQTGWQQTSTTAPWQQTPTPASLQQTPTPASLQQTPTPASWQQTLTTASWQLPATSTQSFTEQDQKISLTAHLLGLESGDLVPADKSLPAMSQKSQNRKIPASSASLYKSNELIKDVIPDLKLTVFIQNVETGMTEDQAKGLLEAFGELTEMKWPIPRFLKVTYANRIDAERAVRIINGLKLFGDRSEVKVIGNDSGGKTSALTSEDQELLMSMYDVLERVEVINKKYQDEKKRVKNGNESEIDKDISSWLMRYQEREAPGQEMSQESQESQLNEIKREAVFQQDQTNQETAFNFDENEINDNEDDRPIHPLIVHDFTYLVPLKAVNDMFISLGAIRPGVLLDNCLHFGFRGNPSDIKVLHNFRFPDKKMQVKIEGPNKGGTLVPDDMKAAMLKAIFATSKVMDLIEKDFKSEIYSEVNVFTYKTRPCKFGDSCLAKAVTCHNYHTDKDRRRSLLSFSYSDVKCPHMFGSGKCQLMDNCPKAHSPIEVVFHFKHYKDNICLGWHKKGSCDKVGVICPSLHPGEGFPEMMYNEKWENLYLEGMQKTIHYLAAAIRNLFKFPNLQCLRVLLITASPEMAKLYTKCVNDLAASCHQNLLNLHGKESTDGATVIIATLDAVLPLLPSTKADYPKLDCSKLKSLIIDDGPTVFRSLPLDKRTVLREFGTRRDLNIVVTADKMTGHGIADAMDCLSLPAGFKRIYAASNKRDFMPKTTSYEKRPSPPRTGPQKQDKQSLKQDKQVEKSSNKPKPLLSTSKPSSAPLSYAPLPTHLEPVLEHLANLRKKRKKGNTIDVCKTRVLKLQKEHELELKMYLETPEVHPDYKQKYIEFAEQYQMQFPGRNDMNHSNKLWKGFWQELVTNALKEEYDIKKKALENELGQQMHSMNTTNVVPQQQNAMQQQQQQQQNSSSNMLQNIAGNPTQTKKKKNKKNKKSSQNQDNANYAPINLPKSLQNQDNANYTPINVQMANARTPTKRMSSPDISHNRQGKYPRGNSYQEGMMQTSSNDGEFNMIEVLSVIDEVCPSLGILGPSIQLLVQKIRSCWPDKNQVSKLLADKENEMILKMVAEKTKTLSETDSFGSHSAKLKLAYSHVLKLLDYMTLGAKDCPSGLDAKDCPSGLDFNKLVMATYDKDPAFIIQYLKNALLYVNINNYTNDDITELYVAVTSAHFNMAQANPVKSSSSNKGGGLSLGQFLDSAGEHSSATVQDQNYKSKSWNKASCSNDYNSEANESENYDTWRRKSIDSKRSQNHDNRYMQNQGDFSREANNKNRYQNFQPKNRQNKGSGNQKNFGKFSNTKNQGDAGSSDSPSMLEFLSFM